ncbi:MAG: lysostaphin resistance A-like protein [Gemmatimonadota bacterium]
MKRTDWIFAVAAVLGVVLFVRGYESAFPAAAIELEWPRDEVRAGADAYLRERGLDPDTFRSTLTFDARGSAATFLQRVRGLEETSRFARETLPLWSWGTRWFRSAEKEEFFLDLAPDGDVLAFEHVLPDAAAGDSLTQDSARVLATAFAAEQMDRWARWMGRRSGANGGGGAGVDTARWRLVDEATRARENRVDHTFTWERIGSEIEWKPEDPEAGTASLRLSVTVRGAEIGGFSRFLKVPEGFERERSRQESNGTLLAVVSFALMFLLVIGALVVGIVRHKHDLVRWRWALVAGGLVTFTVLASGVLGYPLVQAGYQTDVAFPTYIAIAAVAGTLFAVFYGLIIWGTGAAGESLAGETFPGSVRALRDWIGGRWITSAAASEVWRGYAIGLAFLGYITAFYLIGRRYLNVWLPADSPHSQILGMYLPWLVPALIAVQASISEEFMLRLFAIPLLKRYLKITFVALLVPAAIWAFGHSNYPVFPVYVRGIELTIAGLVFGWVFIRYGIVAMLVAHYAIDAILIAMPFLRASGGSYVGYGVAALVCAALPLAIPAAFRLRGDRRERAAVEASGGRGGPGL